MILIGKNNKKDTCNDMVSSDKANSTEGIIIKGVGGAYTVLTGDTIYTCKARGIFRNKNTIPLIGDRVIIDITDEAKKIATLHTIKPRTNELRRPPVANVDQVIIVTTMTSPAFNAGLLDRFLLLIAYTGIPILICVNKQDLAQTNELSPYIKAGYKIVYTSATEYSGLSDLKAHMSGKINVLAGPSGVGKSSLINALSSNHVLATGALSVKLDRGKHTTRHSEIFSLTDNTNDGFCVDTPGFTSLEIGHIPREELAALFLEFGPFLGECRFNNCLHINEKDCAVKAQIDIKIDSARYESYVKLMADYSSKFGTRGGHVK